MDKAGIAVFSSLVGTTAYLGYWQYNRYHWKTQLIQERERQLQLPIVPLAQKPADVAYNRVSITGEFEPAETFFLAPRPPPQPCEKLASGAYLLTLFTQTDGKRLFVNRGWIPRDLSVPPACPQGPVTLTGVCAPQERPSAFAAEHDLAAKRLFWLDRSVLDQVTGESTTVVVEELKDEKNQEQQLPLKKSIANYTEFHITPFKHLSYAATWFTLAFCGIVLTRQRFRRRR